MASSRKHRLIGGGGLAIALLLTTAATVPIPAAHAAAQPGNSGAVALSKSPVPANGNWQSYVESDGAPTVKPVAVVSTTGAVTGAQALANGSGTATLTDVAGQAPPTIVLDYGKEVGGLPFFNVSSASPASPAASVTLRSGYSEAQQYLFGAAPSTALAAPAAAGATNVSVNSVTGFYAGGPLTIGTGASAQSAQITAVGTAAASLKLYAAAAPGDTNIKVTSVANLAAGAPITIDSGRQPGTGDDHRGRHRRDQLHAHRRHGDDTRACRSRATRARRSCGTRPVSPVPRRRARSSSAGTSRSPRRSSPA